MSRLTSWREKLVPSAVFLTLGTGLVAYFLGYEWFWMVFVLGWAVIVPMLAIFFDGAETATSNEHTAGDSRAEDALDTLRDRYARGDIDDAEFERQLEVLLETESIEDTERHLERERE